MEQLDPGYEEPVVRRAPDIPGGPLGPGHSFAEEERLRRLRPTPMGEARAIPPQVPSERVASRLAGGIVRRGGVSRESAETFAQSLMGGERSVLPLGMGLVRDFTVFPGAYFWAADSGQRAGRAMAEGDYGTAAMETGLGLLPLGFAAAAARRAPDAIDRAMRAGGAGARGRQRGMFLVESQTLPEDKAKLTRAKELEATGTPPEQVYAETGWFRDPRQGDIWRYEISDAASAYKGIEAFKQRNERNFQRLQTNREAAWVRDNLDRGRTMEEIAADHIQSFGYAPSEEVLTLAQRSTADQLEGQRLNIRGQIERPLRGLTVGDVMEHEELFRRMPELRSMPFDFEMDKVLGTWAGGHYVPGSPGSMAVRVPNAGLINAPEQAATGRSIALHELQHAAQYGGKVEGGIAPETIGRAEEEARNVFQSRLRDVGSARTAVEAKTLMDQTPGMTAEQALDEVLARANHWGQTSDYAKKGVTVDPESGRPFAEEGALRDRTIAIIGAGPLSDIKDYLKAQTENFDRLMNVSTDRGALVNTSTPEQLYEKYMRNVGEAEARLVQTRAGLTEPQLRERFPMREGVMDYGFDRLIADQRTGYQQTGGLYGRPAAAPMSMSAGPGGRQRGALDIGGPATPPTTLRQELEGQPTTLRTLENLPQNRPFIPVSTIQEQLRRPDISKAEKDVFERVLAGRTTGDVSARELVEASRMATTPYRLTPNDVNSYADYGLERIGRDDRMTGRPWSGDANAFNARTTIHRSPTVTSPDNHFDDPFYFGHTRAFEDAQGIPHVVEIQSDLVQRANKVLTPEERLRLEQNTASVAEQVEILRPFDEEPLLALSVPPELSRVVGNALPRLQELNEDFKLLLGQELQSGNVFRFKYAEDLGIKNLGPEELVDRVLSALKDKPSSPAVQQLSEDLLDALFNVRANLDVRLSENKSKLAAKTDAEAQRPMFKNWERRLIREELGRAATPQFTEEYTTLTTAAKRELKAVKNMEEDLRRAGVSENEIAAMTFQGKKDAEYFAQQALATQKYKPVPSVVRFADADTVAKVEGWTPKLDITPGVAMDPNLANNRLPGGFAGTVNDWRYTGNVRVDKDGFWEAERFPIDATGRTIGDPIWSHSGTGNMSEEVIQRFVKQVPGKFLDAGHQSIYDRYNKEVANYLKSLGGKRVVDDTGTAWWEVPVKPSAKRVPIFSMTGAAVAGGGAAGYNAQED